MSKLEFFYDFSSPFAYLGSTQIEALAERAGAELIWRPMLLGGVFKALNGPVVPIATFTDSKRRHYLRDLHRWAEHWGAPFTWPSNFPMLTLKPLRLALALGREACPPFVHATFRAYWSDGRDISSLDVLGEILDDLGLSRVLLERTADPAVKQELIDSTEEAVARGVFGAPTCFVDTDLMFWGQDRFDFVERALGGWRPTAG